VTWQAVLVGINLTASQTTAASWTLAFNDKSIFLKPLTLTSVGLLTISQLTNEIKCGLAVILSTSQIYRSYFIQSHQMSLICRLRCILTKDCTTSMMNTGLYDSIVINYICNNVCRAVPCAGNLRRLMPVPLDCFFIEPSFLPSIRMQNRAFDR
jgi:hypothetical protein